MTRKRASNHWPTRGEWEAVDMQLGDAVTAVEGMLFRIGGPVRPWPFRRLPLLLRGR